MSPIGTVEEARMLETTHVVHDAVGWGWNGMGATLTMLGTRIDSNGNYRDGRHRGGCQQQQREGTREAIDDVDNIREKG
jgi:hypothetical protein